VWLGFFLYTILESMVPVCELRGDVARATRYRDRRKALGIALNGAAWDGDWYRRAWYDDGAPLGSHESDECRIDALAQAWSVLSGAAPPDRAGKALDAMERLLVDEPAGLIRLLTPPFDRTPHDPGYIKGYLPGIRENGGQYTHAALWAVRALAEAGRGERAAHLLDILNPVLHGDTAEHIATYKVEPYVVAADVYGVAPHIGRGGWTWYTGSAGWMFRVALESVLGMTLLDGKTLVLRPCLPASWPGYTLRYRLPDRKTWYDIKVSRTQGATSVAGLDARVGDGAVHLPLIGDGQDHHIDIALGADLAPHYRPRLSP
jgi:cyclic beta-1,2-glucan synthetase